MIWSQGGEGQDPGRMRFKTIFVNSNSYSFKHQNIKSIYFISNTITFGSFVSLVKLVFIPTLHKQVRDSHHKGDRR